MYRLAWLDYENACGHLRQTHYSLPQSVGNTGTGCSSQSAITGLSWYIKILLFSFDNTYSNIIFVNEPFLLCTSCFLNVINALYKSYSTTERWTYSPSVHSRDFSWIWKLIRGLPNSRISSLTSKRSMQAYALLSNGKAVRKCSCFFHQK